MSPRFDREYLPDGSFMDFAVEFVEPDVWKSHGVRYRLAWVQDGNCRVLFDNHFGKLDHFHIDGSEFAYEFKSVRQLYRDFSEQIKKLGGQREG